MSKRFLFRMTHYQNLEVLLREGALYAYNSPNAQAVYKTSYENLVNRRGTHLATPCGSNLKEFVPFYFSPITGMAYAIHKKQVPLIDPNGTDLDTASMDDIAFMVVDPAALFASGRDCWFTDIACNSLSSPPQYENNPQLLATHIEWALFDESPKKAHISEIGYDGVCKWQQHRDTPVKYQKRNKKRMAEFMVRDRLRADEICCIVLKSQAHQQRVLGWVAASGYEIPVYVKPDCYF